MRFRSNFLKRSLMTSRTLRHRISPEIKLFLTNITPISSCALNHDKYLIIIIQTYQLNQFICYGYQYSLVILSGFVIMLWWNIMLFYCGLFFYCRVFAVILFQAMSFGRSLSPAQIQYLRIGPKAGGSSEIKRQLAEAIMQQKNKQHTGEISANSSLNKIPKLTYGEFQKTVSNFGVLINKNFGNQTLVHQSQKFGKIAQQINEVMLQQKDKPIFNQKKNALLKKIKDRSDNRTHIKTVSEFMGYKLHVTLKSFSLESEKSNEGGLPIPYLRFLIHHVNSARLVKIIQTAIKAQGNQIVVEFDKIQSRASHFSNNQAKYQNQVYEFQRLGQTLKINLPCVQFHEPQTNFQQKVYLLNKEIIQIIQSNFDNIADIMDKYLDTASLQAIIQGFKKPEQKYGEIRERHQPQQQQQQDEGGFGGESMFD